MDLAHAALGHAEHLADLGQRQVLEVVEGQDDLLPLGHPLDRLGELAPELAALQQGPGPVAAVRDRVAEGGAVAPVPQHLVERGDAGERELPEHRLQLRVRHVELGGELGLGRRPLEPGLQLGERPLDGAALGPDRARHPVDRAELVEDGALDAGDGVGLELEPAGRIELLDGVDEAEDAVADQVRLLDVLGQADRHAAGDVLDERRVVEDQPVPSRARRGRVVAVPELADLVGTHRMAPPS